MEQIASALGAIPPRGPARLLGIGLAAGVVGCWIVQRDGDGFNRIPVHGIRVV
jgi:hypothetical protein